MGEARANAELVFLLWNLGSSRGSDRRAAADSGGQLPDLRAALGRADRLKLLQIGLRASERTHFDHRFALDGDRVRIVRLKEKRLVGHADRLAEQMLLFRDPGEVDERPTIARIDCQRGLQRILGLFELARAKQSLALSLKVSPFRGDLI